MGGVKGAVAAAMMTTSRTKTTVARLVREVVSGVRGAVAATAMTASKAMTTAARLVKGAVDRAKGAAAAADEILMKTQITRRQTATTRGTEKSAVKARAEVEVEIATETRSAVARAVTPPRTAPTLLRLLTPTPSPLTVATRGIPGVDPLGVAGALLLVLSERR